MKTTYFGVMIIFFVMILTACQEKDQTQSNSSPLETEQTDQANTEVLDSNNQDSQGNQTVNNGEENSNGKVNNSETSESNSSNQLEGLIKEKSYASETEAVNVIDNYHVVKQTNLDLGHGIKGFSEGAAGHQYISWNEGNWMIEINFPSDPEYAINGYEDGNELATAVVNYLEDHLLPPPSQRGTIQINGFRQHPETIIRWQQGKTVYEIDQKTADPIEALQIAVDSHQS